MPEIPHPDIETVSVTAVLQALSDPMRLAIVRNVHENGEQCCGACGLPIAKNTLSHHFKVLREAGVIRVRVDGTQRCISLRRKELNARFPGLLAAVLKSAETAPVKKRSK